SFQQQTLFFRAACHPPERQQAQAAYATCGGGDRQRCATRCTIPLIAVRGKPRRPMGASQTAGKVGVPVCRALPCATIGATRNMRAFTSSILIPITVTGGTQMMVESFNTGSPLLDLVATWGLRIGLALAVFFVGRMVVNWIVRLTERTLRTRGMDEFMVRVATYVLAWPLLFLFIIGAVSQWRIDTTAFVALLGSAGLAGGLTLQDSMKNVASGVLLIIF